MTQEQYQIRNRYDVALVKYEAALKDWIAKHGSKEEREGAHKYMETCLDEFARATAQWIKAGCP